MSRLESGSLGDAIVLEQRWKKVGWVDDGTQPSSAHELFQLLGLEDCLFAGATVA